jgi:hypothetical protein
MESDGCFAKFYVLDKLHDLFRSDGECLAEAQPLLTNERTYIRGLTIKFANSHPVFAVAAMVGNLSMV